MSTGDISDYRSNSEKSTIFISFLNLSRGKYCGVDVAVKAFKDVKFLKSVKLLKAIKV